MSSVFNVFLQTILFAFFISCLTGKLEAAETIKLAHIFGENTQYHELAVKIANEVNEQTDGKVRIQIFPNGNIAREGGQIDKLNSGEIHLSFIGSSFIAPSYPPISITEFPYVLRNIDHWFTYFTSDVFKTERQNYWEITGNRILSVIYYGTRHVTANKPIVAPQDMAGLKIRVPNAAPYMIFPNTLKSYAIPISFGEVYSNLNLGVVEAQENPLPTIKFMRFYEVHKHINLTGHMMITIFVIASEKTIEMLGERTMNRIARIAEKHSLDTSRAIAQTEYDLIAWFRDRGTTLNIVDKASFSAPFRTKYLNEEQIWPRTLYQKIQAMSPQ